MPLPAETGWDEISEEFSKRIKYVVLHLGEQPQEGEIPGRPEETFKQTLLDHVTEASEGLDLKVALQNCYSEDSFFSVILENLGIYKNFQEINGLMFTKDKEHDLLCIPDIRING